MDRVFIRGLTTKAIIGVYPWEKEVKQILIFDIEMAWDTTLAVASDNVKDCLNYADVSQAIIEFCQNNSFNLVETLADKIAQMLQQRFKIKWLKIILQKPDAIPEANTVGVIIERKLSE